MSSAPELATAATVPPPAPADADGRIAPGTLIAGRYSIARVLGEGGMGVVYAAEHVLMRKEVALKVLHANMCTMPEVVARFEREAIAAAHIDHPNVAGATDFGRLPDGSCYLVLELLRGTSLRDQIAKGPIPRTRALRILRGITAGVGAAHTKGIVHRDLKPENVMLVDRDGDDEFVKVLDFGIAKVDSSVAEVPRTGAKIVTRVGTIFGTPEYMAPEQAVGDVVDARADFFALGVIYLEMLIGRCPFTGDVLSIMRERILAVGPPDLSGIENAGDRALLTRLLARYPDDRPASAAELLLSIESLMEPTARISIEVAATGPLPSSAAATAATGFGLDAGEPGEAEVPARRWVLPAVIATALAAGVLGFGLFTGVHKRTQPVLPTDDDTAEEASATAAPPASGASAEITGEPPPAATGEAQAPAETKDEPAPKPSAASARAAPRGKPAPKTRHSRKTGPGGVYVPPPKDWFK